MAKIECGIIKSSVKNQIKAIEERLNKIDNLKEQEAKLKDKIKKETGERKKIIKEGIEYISALKESLNESYKELKQLQKEFKRTKKLNPLGSLALNNNYYENESIKNIIDRLPLRNDFIVRSIQYLSKNNLFDYFKNFFGTEMEKVLSEMNPEYEDTQIFKDYDKFAYYLSKVDKQTNNLKALGLTTNSDLYNRVMYRSIGNEQISNIEYKDGELITYDKDGNEIKNKFDEYLYLLSEEYTDNALMTHRVLNPIVIKTIEALLPDIYHTLNGYKYISLDKAAKIAGFKNKEDFDKRATFDEKQNVYQLLKTMREKGLPQYELANEIGSMIVQELGIKFNENSPATFNENLKNSLGLHVLNSFTIISSATTNEQSLFKIVKNSTQFNNKEMNLFKIEFKDEKQDELFSKGFKGYTTFSSYITKRDNHQTDPIEPNRDIGIDPKVKKTVGTDVAPEAATFMKNASNNNVYIANNAFDAFINLSPEVREKIAGAIDTSNVHYSNINNVNSNNDDVKRRIEFMELFKGIVKSGFKTSWYQAINMRTHMDSSVNMQDNKIQRHLLKIKDTMESKIDLTDKNSNEMYMFKLAIAQAFDLEPDKNTDEDIFNKLNKLFIIKKNGLAIQKKGKEQGLDKAINAMIKLLNNKELSIEEQNDIANFVDGKENVHAFHALVELTRMHMSAKNGETKFQTDLALESDAITSGMIISLQNMLFSGMFYNDLNTKNQIESLLAKGGFYILRKELQNINNFDKLSNEEKNKIVDKMIGNLGLEPSEVFTEKDKKQFKKDLREFKKDLIKGELTHGKLLTSKFFKDFYNSLSTYVNNVVKDEQYMKNMFYEKGELDEKGNVKTFFDKDGNELIPYTVNDKLNSIAIFNLLNKFRDDKGEVKFTREIVKPAMMVKNYGASLKAIMRKLYGTTILDPIYKDLAYFGYKGLKLGNLYESILNKYSMPNLDEKDLKEYKKLVAQVKGIILSNYNDRFKTEIKDIKDIKEFTSQMIHNFFTAYEHNELTDRIVQHSLFADTSLDKPIDKSVLDLTLEKIDIRPNLIKSYYNNVFEPILGTIFKKAFDDNLGMLDKFQEKLQNISRLTFNTTYPILINKLNYKFGKRDLHKYSQKEYEEVIKEMINEGIWYDFDSAFAKSSISSEKTEKSKSKSVIRIGTNNGSLTTTIQEVAKVFAENLPAIGPIMAHQTDSTYMIQTLNSDDAYKRIVHVFDALLFGLESKNLNSIRDYNKSVFDNSVKYNIYLSLLHKMEILIKNPETRQYLGRNYSEFVNDNIDKKNEQLALINNNYNGLGSILAELLDENLLNTAMNYIKDTLDNSKISVLHNYVTDKKDTIYTPEPEDVENIMKEMFITLNPEEDFLNIEQDLVKEIFYNAYNPVNDEKINIANTINAFFFAKEFLETKNNKEYNLDEVLNFIKYGQINFNNKDKLHNKLNNIIGDIKSDKDKDLKKTMNESKFYKYSKFRKLVKDENPTEPNGDKDIEEQTESNNEENQQEQNNNQQNNIFNIDKINTLINDGNFEKALILIQETFKNIKLSKRQIDILDEYMKMRKKLINLNEKHKDDDNIGNSDHPIKKLIISMEQFKEDNIYNLLFTNYEDSSLRLNHDYLDIHHFYTYIRNNITNTVKPQLTFKEAQKLINNLKNEKFGELGEELKQEYLKNLNRLLKIKGEYRTYSDAFKETDSLVLGGTSSKAPIIYNLLKVINKEYLLSRVDGSYTPFDVNSLFNALNIINESIHFPQKSKMYKSFIEYRDKQYINNLGYINILNNINKFLSNNNQQTQQEEQKGSSQVTHLGSKQSEQTFKNEQELEQFIDTLNEDFNPVQQSTMNKIKSALHTVFNKAKELKIEHFINNTFNRGSALVKRNIIRLSKSGGLSLQNEKEIFLHEMTHMVTHTAFTYDAKLRTRMLQLQKAVLNHMYKNNVNSETFFIPIGMAHTDVAKQRSKEMFEYIKGDPEEFFTVATTNPILNRYINNNNINVKQEWLQEMDNQNILDKFLNSIMNVFNKVLSLVGTKKANKELNDIFTTAVAITNDIKNGQYKPTPTMSKIHLDKIINLTRNLPIVKQSISNFSRLSKALINSLEKGYEKGIQSLENRGKNIYKVHQQSLAAFNFSVVDLIRDLQSEMFKDRTKDTDFYKIFNEIKHTQETVRMQQEVANINLLNELVPKGLQTHDKLNSLTNGILNTDLGSLDIREAVKYVSDDNARKQKINNIENMLSDDPQGQLMINQAKALAYYMNTGISTINNLQLNAHNIDNRYFILDPNERYISDISYEKELDKLITLYSLDYLDPNDMNNLKEFINTDVNNFKNLLRYIKSTIKQDTLTLFEEPTHIIKGYSKPKSKSIYETVMINSKDLSKYEAHGWQIYRTYSQDNTNIASDVKQVYLMRRVNTEPEYSKGAFEITRNTSLGSKISEIYLGDENADPTEFYEKVLPKIKVNLSIVNSDPNFDPKQTANNLTSNNQQKLVPLIDSNGNIVDYRYTLDKTTNTIANELDMDIRKVIANTQSHMFLKINGKEINEKLVNFLQKKYNNSNDKDLVTIGYINYGKDKVLVGEEYYSILPENTKRYLSWNGGYFKVPRYMLNNVIGYKNQTIYHSFLFTKYDKKTGKFVDRFNSKTINKLRRKLQLFEKYWKDFIKTVKPLMVISNGAVLLGNLMSNFWVLSQFMPIEQAFREMRKNWIEYDKLHKEYIKLRTLEPKVRTGIATKQEKLEYNYLKQSIKRNRLNTIYESGAVGSIIEDATISDINNANILEYKFEQYIGSKIPPKSKSILKTLFISEESSPFKKAMKIMQYGDVVAKQTLMDYYIKQGLSKDEALIKADQYFINYNLNQNKMIKYLSDIGALMFSKFLFGSIKVMIQTLKEKPEGILKLGAINELIDVPEIYETYDKPLVDIITNRQIHFYQEAENLVNPYSRIERMFSY